MPKGMKVKSGKRRYVRRLVVQSEDKTHRTRDGYLIRENGEYEHRAIYREKIGRIPKYHIVHHIDHNKLNNEPDNLIALLPHFHDKLHAQCRREGRYIPRDDILRLAADYEELYRSVSARLSVLYAEKIRLDKEIVINKKMINMK